MSENKKPNIIKPIFGVVKGTAYFAVGATSLCVSAVGFVNALDAFTHGVRTVRNSKGSDSSISLKDTIKNIPKGKFIGNLLLGIGAFVTYVYSMKASSECFGIARYQFKEAFGRIKEPRFANTLVIRMTNDEYKAYLSKMGKVTSDAIVNGGSNVEVEATLSKKVIDVDPLEENKVEKPAEVNAASNKAQKRVRADLENKQPVLDPIDTNMASEEEISGLNQLL